MGKNIIFCADGTWNNPYEDENCDSCADPTNVYKLFLCLSGEPTGESMRNADEQEKESCAAGAPRQVAKYLHGVGDSRNPIHKLLGGAFGAGVISRIVRGYSYISRKYEAGDNIFIVGFSRGAYTARALGGLIASQGLLAPAAMTDQETGYRRGAQAWYRYRKAVSKPTVLAYLAEIAADLPAFMSCGSLQDADLVPVDKIQSIAVWDTVGAMGFPNYHDNKCEDAFRFTDTNLSSKVVAGFHAVSLDERREAFTPTLWTPAPNVTQVLFPGAHADVGGGYPVAGSQSGLSDLALAWMMKQLKSQGAYFCDAPQCTIQPSPLGTAHQPWTHNPWPLPCFPKGERDFTGWAIPGDPSIALRQAAASVLADPDLPPAPYCPGNLPAA